MPRSLALAWRLLLVVSLAVNPLVGLRAALASQGHPVGTMPCQHMTAGDLAGMPGMAGMAGTKVPTAHDADSKPTCPCGSGCGVPACDFAACCGPAMVALPIIATSLAQALPAVRPNATHPGAAPAPDIESLIRPPIA